MVRDFLIAKRKEGYGPGSISGMRNLLSGALGAARLEDIIVSNPALGHQIGSAPSGFMVPGASADMAKRVIEAVDKTRFDDLISILVYLPARSGEIVRLDWSLVHFDTRMVTVLRTETRVKAPVGSGLRSVRGSGDTKTSAGRRTIPIPEEALMRLQERHWQARMPAFGLVFPSMTNPLVPVSPRWVLKEFQALMAAATPPIPLTKIHQLRHLGISLLISAGVPLPVVSKIAGHADPSITAKLYAHVMGDAEEQAIEHLRFQPLRLLDGIPVSEWEIDPESTL